MRWPSNLEHSRRRSVARVLVVSHPFLRWHHLKQFAGKLSSLQILVSAGLISLILELGCSCSSPRFANLALTHLSFAISKFRVFFCSGFYVSCRLHQFGRGVLNLGSIVVLRVSTLGLWETYVMFFVIHMLVSYVCRPMSQRLPYSPWILFLMYSSGEFLLLR